MMRFRFGLNLILLLSGVLLFTSGCSKDKKNHRLTVVVVADGDVRVTNSLVRVYAPVDDTYIDWYIGTNEKGEAYFEFENDVVVDIIATKGSFKGCGFAQVKAGENTATVEVKPWGSNDNGCPETTP